jgi:hypothetical protein
MDEWIKTRSDSVPFVRNAGGEVPSIQRPLRKPDITAISWRWFFDDRSFLSKSQRRDGRDVGDWAETMPMLSRGSNSTLVSVDCAGLVERIHRTEYVSRQVSVSSEKVAMVSFPLSLMARAGQ